jgi:diadenosine tetraphosphate (Ap4A) HIT family hydrolase
MGARYFAGDVADAYLVRADIQRWLSIVVWRGRHVVEPTELSDEEAAANGREVLIVGRALEQTFSAVKRNYNLLGNWDRWPGGPVGERAPPSDSTPSRSR